MEASGASAFGASPKHAAEPIMHDQKATHRSVGMTMSPLRICRYRHEINVSITPPFRQQGWDKHA